MGQDEGDPLYAYSYSSSKFLKIDWGNYSG